MESMHTMMMVNNSGNYLLTVGEKKHESRIKTTSESTGTEQ